MKRTEVRYRLTAALLQADGPLARAEARRAGVAARSAGAALREMAQDGLVVEGDLVPGERGPHVRWRARWDEEVADRAGSARVRLQAAVDATRDAGGHDRPVRGASARAFHDFIVRDYKPPADKRWLVFFQCCVRRPFYVSPSHGSMRKAVALATGLDPAKDFEACPVHVVVLASTVGPAPYEFQDVYPVNVRGGGVKHFAPEFYDEVKPVLARRMADYIVRHGARYERMAAFTQGRYADVMGSAAQMASGDLGSDVHLSILPVYDGPQVAGTKGRAYWVRFWIQLYLEIVSWLDPARQAQAGERLARLGVEFG